MKIALRTYLMELAAYLGQAGRDWTEREMNWERVGRAFERLIEGETDD